MGGALCKQMERSEMKAEPVFPSFVFVMATPGDLHVPSVCATVTGRVPARCGWSGLNDWWSVFHWNSEAEHRSDPISTRTQLSSHGGSEWSHQGGAAQGARHTQDMIAERGGLDLFLVLCLEVVRTELRDQTCEPISLSWRGIGGRNYVAMQDFHSRRHEIADRRIVSLFILISHTVPWCT